jgi:hypothetical protein
VKNADYYRRREREKAGQSLVVGVVVASSLSSAHPLVMMRERDTKEKLEEREWN